MKATFGRVNTLCVYIVEATLGGVNTLPCVHGGGAGQPIMLLVNTGNIW
jgi:hypothetical protein